MRAFLLLSVALTSFWPAAGIQLPPVAQEGSSLQQLGGEGCDAAQTDGKELDLIIYGATGFTGELAARYLSTGLPGAPRWGIGGRHEADLASLSSALSAGGGSRKGPSAVFVADLRDTRALQAMTQRTRVVLTLAGPYEQYGGENMIKAAISTCTHYVDIAGETAWKAEMMQKYGDEAQARGLAVVQSAGSVSLPPDLISMLAAEEVAADGRGPPTEVAVLWSKMNRGTSGGTVASGVYQALHHPPTGPYALAPGATPQVSPAAAVALFDEEHSPYIMADVDLPVIHRSMSLRFPGLGISVSEDSGPGVAESLAAFRADPRMLTDPPPANPKPGEGPPAWMLKEGGLAAEARARRSADGRTAAVRVDGAGDPGHQGCARFSVELALGLARRGPAVSGFPTPSLALGPARLREILEAADGGRLMNFTSVQLHN